MSEIGDEEFFAEFGIEDPFNRNRGLDWFDDPAAVAEFANYLPMSAGPMAQKLAALAVEDVWFARFSQWIIFGRSERLLNLCRDIRVD